jgi:DNA-binding SARP family transcriptional activator
VSRHYFVAFFTLLLLGGCALSDAPLPNQTDSNTTEQNSSAQPVQNLNFAKNADEESLFMASVLAIQDEKYDEARLLLQELYSKNHKEIYLLQLVQLSVQTGHLDQATELLEERLTIEPDNLELKKALTTLLLSSGDFERAKMLATQIADTVKTAATYDLAASISIYLQDFPEAVKDLKAAYELSPDEALLDKTANILFIHLGKKNEAITLYETHIKLYGCSKFICERLTLAYEEAGRTVDAIEIYKKLYSKFKVQSALKRVIEIYLSTYRVDDLIAFLQSSKADDVILLEAYKYKKDFVMASRTARKIYAKTKDLKFLGQAALYKFEANSKKSKKLIDETVQNLTLVLQGISDDVYENYLGYILIDYDVDCAKGVEYVRRALVKDPKSPFYLDSLAWGLYKQNKCAEAYEAVKVAYEGAKDDKTVQEHYELIKKCVEKK